MATLSDLGVRDSDTLTLVVAARERAVLTASSDRTAAFWSLDTGERLFVIDGHEGPVYRPTL